MSPKPTRTVPFHDPPPQKSYKETIAKVKAAGRDKPGDLSDTPRFDSLPEPPPPEAPTSLSESTIGGLEALAQEAERQRLLREELEESAEEKIQEPEKTQEQKVRAAIEARCSVLDIGQYLMGGELLQTVPIVPDKLVVKFRTVTDLEEVYVDDALSKDEKMTGRQFVRRTNEWALATHVHSLNGVKWAKIFDGDGTVSDKAMDQRMGNVRKLNSPVFNLLMTNLSWFLDRVNNSLTLEALGNG